MISTLWRDGYGTAVEAYYGGPEDCPDGITRRWIDLLITDREHDADPTELALRLDPAELAELAGMLAELAEAVDR